jgi:hypothetical protein
MNFSVQELRCIAEAQEFVRLLREGIFTDAEPPGSLVFELARWGSDRIIPYCLAVLPREVRPAIERLADEMAASGFRRDPVGFVGRGPSPEVWAAIRRRYRPVVKGIRAFYRELDERPDLLESLAVPEVDIFWVTLKEIGPVEGEICRSEGCDRPRVRVSVFCDRHHYEQIAKKAAPDY